MGSQGTRGQRRSPCGDTKQGAEVTPVGATAPCPPGAALSRIIPLRGLLAPRERGLCWGGCTGWLCQANWLRGLTKALPPRVLLCSLPRGCRQVPKPGLLWWGPSFSTPPHIINPKQSPPSLLRSPPAQGCSGSTGCAGTPRWGYGCSLPPPRCPGPSPGLQCCVSMRCHRLHGARGGCRPFFGLLITRQQQAG